MNLAALQVHPGDDVEIQRPLSFPGLGVLPCPCNPAVPGGLRAVAPLVREMEFCPVRRRRPRWQCTQFGENSVKTGFVESP